MKEKNENVSDENKCLSKLNFNRIALEAGEVLGIDKTIVEEWVENYRPLSLDRYDFASNPEAAKALAMNKTITKESNIEYVQKPDQNKEKPKQYFKI